MAPSRARDTTRADAASFEKRCLKAESELEALREEGTGRALELKRLEKELEA